MSKRKLNIDEDKVSKGPDIDTLGMKLVLWLVGSLSVIIILEHLK